MSANDPSGGDGRNLNEIQRKAIETLNSLLRKMDVVINDIEQRTGRLREYIIQQLPEHQPQEIATTIVDLNLRDNKLFQLKHELCEYHDKLKKKREEFISYIKALNKSISIMAKLQRDQKTKELNCQKEIEEKKAEIEMRMKSKSRMHREQQIMVMNYLRLIFGAEQIRLKAVSNSNLFHEMISKANSRARRADLALFVLDFFIIQTITLSKTIDKERVIIAKELRRKANEIAQEVNRQQEGQATTTAESIVVLIAIAAAVGRRHMRQEATNGSAE